MESEIFKIINKVEKFPGKGGWMYVRVSDGVVADVKSMSMLTLHYGLIPIEATLGNTTWKTSLLPLGKGKMFIALNKKVQKQEKFEVGKEVLVKFILRDNWKK